MANNFSGDVSMTMLRVQEILGVKPSSHASIRRAINKILKKSEGRVPYEDLLRIQLLITIALARDATK